MDVRVLVTPGAGAAAIYFGGRSIVHFVDETVLKKSREGAEYRGLVHRRESHLHIREGKWLGISENLPHQQDSVRRGLYASFLKYLFNSVHKKQTNILNSPDITNGAHYETDCRYSYDSAYKQTQDRIDKVPAAQFYDYSGGNHGH